MHFPHEGRWIRPCRARLVLLIVTVYATGLVAQTSAVADTTIAKAKPKKAWYESFSIRGYGQVRYNRLLETNDQLKCEQCDRSWGDNGGFFIRRARIIFGGYVHPQVYIYLQPDFASSAGSTGNVAQLRDWYVDAGIDAKNEFRFRIGQSKVPYSFENIWYGSSIGAIGLFGPA